MPVPIEHLNRISNLEVLQDQLDPKHKFSQEHYNRVRIRILEVERDIAEEKLRLSEAGKGAEERRELRKARSRGREVRDQSRGRQFDYRNWEYACKRFRAIWKQFTTACAFLIAGYKWLENEEVVPPIKVALQFLGGFHEVWILLFAVAVLLGTLFAVIVLDELSRTQNRT